MNRPLLGDGEGERAVAEVEGLVQDEDFAGLAAPLFDRVKARDAEVHAALADGDDDVAGALEHHGEAGERRDAREILARVGLVHTQTGGGQEINRGQLEGAFGGEGEADIGSRLHRLSLTAESAKSAETSKSKISSSKSQTLRARRTLR